MTYVKKQLPPITDKQLEIIHLLIKFRLINTNHFQQIFNHKDPHRIKVWLKDLVEKRYIYTNYSKKEFISQPAIYRLDINGRAKLKQEGKYPLKILDRIYEDKTRDESYIKERFSLVSLYIYFLKLQKQDTTLQFFTDSDLADYEYLPHKILSAYVAVKNSKEKKRYFVTIYDPLSQSENYKKVVVSYLYYFESHKWDDNTNNLLFPGVLLVFPNEKAKMHMFHFARAILNDRFSLFLATVSQVENPMQDKSIWLAVE